MGKDGVSEFKENEIKLLSKKAKKKQNQKIPTNITQEKSNPILIKLLFCQEAIKNKQNKTQHIQRKKPSPIKYACKLNSHCQNQK